MRDRQSKKGDSLMIVHKNKQVSTELEHKCTKQEDMLILRGTLKNISINLVYFSVIRGESEKKIV